MDQNTKILILQHDSSDEVLLETELKRSFTNCIALLVQTKKDFETALHEFSPSIILSDYSLPSFDWNDAFNLKQKIAPAVPFILMSGAIGEEAAVELIKNGVTDYALKGKPGSLAPKILRALKEAEESKAKSAEYESLQQSILNLRAIFENTEVGFLFLNASYQVVAYNYICSHWAANVFGVELKEKADFKILLQPERLAEFSAFGEGVLGGETITYETSYPKTDGSLMWLIVSGKPVISDQKIIGICIGITDITAHKLAEGELKHSESRLKQAQALGHLGSWELDLTTNIAWWSDEACRIYGLAPGENLQPADTFLSFVHPDDLPFVTKTINDSRESLKDTSSYHRIIRKDGQLRYIHSERKYEFDAEGKPHTLFGISHDITEIKEVEEELRKSETTLRTIFENTDVGFLLLDLDGKVVSVNTSERWAKSVLGVPLVKGMKLRETLIPGKVVEFDQLMTALKNGGRVDYEINYPDAAGILTWFCVSGRPVVEIGGKIVGICLAANDITDKKLAEDNLKAVYERLLFHMENSPLGFIECDIQLVVKSLSKQAEEIFGWSEEECISTQKSGYSMVYEEDKPYVNKLMKKLLSGELERCSAQNRNYTKDGRVIWCEWYTSAMKNKEGKVETLLSLVQDITNRKETENQINELNEHLEERVQERTAELTDANKALEAFSYSVSHDLRAPVRAVLSFSKIIQKEFGDKMDPDIKELFGYIEDSGKRMGAIIEDLLKLAKYGTEVLKIVPVDMMQLVKGIWSSIGRTYSHHAVLRLEQLPVIPADMSMMEQVVINLISNSIKYSSKTKNPVVTVWCERAENNISFYFKDNGAGFNMDNYDRLFGAFQRLHSQGEFEGTGVGLTLVKRIMEKHLGHIWAEGKVNEGATFCISLPFLEPQSAIPVPADVALADV